MTTRFFSIHAHFYQPPREDPLTGLIPHEAGSSPFSNWNERIHAECYRPNAELGNFERISFNVGPTLCAWMSSYDPDTCRKIAAQDQANVRRYGVGNAIAQAYNHTILPLASYQDKVTQVSWGIAEFKQRFGREPQGMWLPETAVDMETLSVLADQGLEFTILAPWQAEGSRLDTTEPYRVSLPHGRSITVFFYHSELSAGMSFNPGMTVNADNFALYDLAPYYQPEKTQHGEPQLILLATDGELYGHHQPLRDHFLAHLVNGASSHLGIDITYPALWLKSYPPRRTIRIREDTSWSCHHGVSRWTGNCACTPGDGRWKAQLRYAFERFSNALDDLYVDVVKPYIADPWALRNRYIDVMHGLLPVEDLIAELAGRRLSTDTNVRIHLLLEAQRERQRIYTSCGWFFDDFDRIEPKNNIAYAAQAVRLVRMATGLDLEPYMMADLKRVVSPRTRLRGDRVFQRHMKRAVMDGRIVAGD
jgi:alpha-amylase/alpha-mannosidase (GH57 family)